LVLPRFIHTTRKSAAASIFDFNMKRRFWLDRFAPIGLSGVMSGRNRLRDNEETAQQQHRNAVEEISCTSR
jgi:hypothetical protein